MSVDAPRPTIFTSPVEDDQSPRLIGAVRSMPAAPVRAIIGRIMTSADVFVAGAPQYDDRTLIVQRVSE
jgi:hypothetical protein